MKRIDHIASRMEPSDKKTVQESLDNSAEAHIFMELTNPGSRPCIWRLLSSFRGRSPLMEAALWGRYENVKHLLDFGADKNLEDGEGFTAMQLAEPSTRNGGERYRRWGREIQVYKEITYVANQVRRMIVHLLSDATEDVPSVPKSNYDHHVFCQKETVIRLSALVAAYQVPNEWKTISRLERGHPYFSVSAMSGWSDAPQVPEPQLDVRSHENRKDRRSSACVSPKRPGHEGTIRFLPC
ncbi:uncharacterized protein Z519_08985 [Cladophialophora bantiana CBS 173.52]|uniref:Ankyrin repeat protein n=1 Tax=Cladophialophora bantiana (strain ATCC 10958 / CBS 173.52 / CDC B-1940 / NIH 8579) TaxID=1442370 RepID=A0A0D2EK03_CLAB1|nr:uncharacterized protein Z519_08985 [Cladophialophora bantiana CBS 173.52]KIW90341.1 hypothetical protein Z519_08985 [Cladophialophora bantiana CBS 173.52]